MRRILLITIIFLTSLLFSGCAGGTESFIAGTAAGAGLSHTFDGARADLDARRQQLLTAQQQALDDLESATDQAAKAASQARIAALQKQLELNAGLQSSVDIGREALATDWTDLNQTAPWINSGVMALLWYLTKRKNKSLSGLLKAFGEGVEKYKAVSDPAQARRLYDIIGERKKINNVS